MKTAVVAAPPFAVTYIGKNSTNAGQTTYTWTAQSIGAADPTRLVVVGFSFSPSASASISSVSIGGSGASLATGSTAIDGANVAGSSIYYLAVAAGTTADISITFNANQTRCAIEVYSVTGTGAAFSAGNGATVGAGSSSVAAAVTVPSGGGAIVVSNMHSATAGTVTGTNNTIDDFTVNGSSVFAGGHASTGTGASTTFTHSWGGSTTNASISVASFVP
jgi:hypothetical protein